MAHCLWGDLAIGIDGEFRLLRNAGTTFHEERVAGGAGPFDSFDQNGDGIADEEALGMRGAAGTVA